MLSIFQPANPLHFKRIQSAPWFDIMLFETRARLRIPRSTAKPKRTWNNRKIDMRPFVNTEAKYAYGSYCGSSGLAQLFAARWLYRRIDWRNKIHAELIVGAIGVRPEHREEYPDLQEDSVAIRWIKRLVTEQAEFFSQFTLHREEGSNYVEIQFNDQHRLALPDDMAECKVTLGHIANQATAFFVQPYPNQINAYIPFGPADMLILMLGYIDNTGEISTDMSLCQQNLLNFIQALAATVEIFPRPVATK